MAFVYVPNGKHMPDWTPQTEGADFELPSILEPLAPVKKQLLVLSGLAQDKAGAHGDGAGDHARALSSFLTGRKPARPTAPISRSASRSTRSPRKDRPARPGFLRWNWVAIAARRPATATRAIAAPTRPTSPGAPRARPMPRRSIPSWSSSGCFPAARPSSAPSARRSKRACSTSCSKTPTTCTPGSAPDQRKLDEYLELGPRARNAHRSGRAARPTSRCPTIRGPPAFPRTTPSTSA